MDRTLGMLMAGTAILVIGLAMSMALPNVVLEDPEEAGTSWAGAICGGFLVAMLGAILLLTGAFRLQSARRTQGRPPETPPVGHGCPHAREQASGVQSCAGCGSDRGPAHNGQAPPAHPPGNTGQ